MKFPWRGSSEVRVNDLELSQTRERSGEVTRVQVQRPGKAEPYTVTVCDFEIFLNI